MLTSDLPHAITGASAWLGCDLRAREADWVVQLTPAHCAELDAAIGAFQAAGSSLATITPAQFALPTLGPLLRGVLDELLEGRGFVLLRGFPVERYARAAQAVAFMGLGSHLGVPRSQNAKGHLLGHVKDLGLDVSDPNVRYYQTHRRLEYHTDSCDIVGLLCLQTAKSGGESFVVSSMTLYNEVRRRRPDLLAALFQPYPTDRRGEVPEGMQPWFDMPIFHWHADRLSCIYVRQYIDSAQRNFPQAARLTPQQIEAMDLLDALANDPQIHLSMAFRPGDMQFLHNHVILHSRNDFENWPEPARQRHLLRLWLAPREGRALPEVFAPRYGSVTPGARGGIVVRGTRLSVPMEAE
ncbi:MAG: TauD/TfdA family dioxygenase [Burkholderiales bacterium]|nr:TauD/TfdA family dioxygenase [Burkholderiales bacterium]